MKRNPLLQSINENDKETELLVWLHVLWLLIELDFGQYARQIGSTLSKRYHCGQIKSDLRARYVQAVVVGELASFRGTDELTPKSRSRLGELMDKLDEAVKGELHLPLEFWHKQFEAMGRIYTLLGRSHQSLRELVNEYVDKLKAYGDTVTTTYAIAKLRLMFWAKHETFKRSDFRTDFSVIITY